MRSDDTAPGAFPVEAFSQAPRSLSLPIRSDEYLRKRSADDTLVEEVPAGIVADVPRKSAIVGDEIAGRYRMTKLLGMGNYGTVFCALDLMSGAEVAVKVLHDRHTTSRDLVGRLLREARIAREIAHPGVARVLDAGRDDEGRVYLVLEKLEGRDFGTILDEGKELSKDLVVEVGRQVLSVLSAAHKIGVVHRDVKPENIFLQRDDGKSVRVKLLDFGIAKLNRALPASAVRTGKGLTLGTPWYMSPEQWRGDELGPQSDVWSVGAVLFHALSGRPPHDGMELGAIRDSITTWHADSISVIREDCGPALTQAIDRALMLRKEDRWCDAAAMASALTANGASVDDLDWDD